MQTVLPELGSRALTESQFPVGRYSAGSLQRFRETQTSTFRFMPSCCSSTAHRWAILDGSMPLSSTSIPPRCRYHYRGTMVAAGS